MLPLTRFRRFSCPTTYSGWLVLLCLLFIGCGGADDADDDGLIPMFDGETLAGWEGNPIHWSVENGAIVGRIAPSTIVERNSFLIWRGGTPGDFELTVEYRLSPGGNSGINYRSQEVDSLPYVLKGYQADMDYAHRYTGMTYEEQGRRTLALRGEVTELPPLPDTSESIQPYLDGTRYTLRQVVDSLPLPSDLDDLIEADGWNEYRIVAQGYHLRHYINGTLMSEVTDNDPVRRRTEGLIGVQVHAGPPMKVEYRNWRLKPL